MTKTPLFLTLLLLPATLITTSLFATVATNLPPVVVTAGRMQQPLTNLPATVQMVDRQTIEKSGATSVDAALGRIVGADHVSYGLPGASVKFDLRGLTSDYQSKSALVLMDGRRMNEAFQGNVEYSQLVPDNVDHVIVIKGPGSYAYGSGALGGIVNIESRSGRDTEPFVELSAAGGNYETYTAHADGGGQFGPFDAYVGVGHVQTAGYRPVPNGRVVDWDAEDYFGNFGWSPGPNDEFRLLIGYYNGDGTDREGPRTVQRTYETAVWKHAWDPDLDELLTVRDYNTFEHSTYDVILSGIYRDYHLRTTGADIQETLHPCEDLHLLFGGDVRQDAADIVDFVSFDHSEWMAGLFAEGDVDLTDKLVFSLGARFDKNERFDGRVSPRAALLYRLEPGMEVYASVSQAYRTPGISDRYIDTKFGPYEILGNPELKPTILTCYETGIRARIGNTASWSAAVFHNDIRDAFDFASSFTPPSTITLWSVNASRSYTQGIEAEGQMELGAGFDVFANASYTQAKVTEDIDPSVVDKRLANLAPVKTAVGIAWHSDRQSHGLSGCYESGRFEDAPNTTKLGGYMLFNWASRYAITQNFALTLNIDNLFDHSYRVYDLTEPNGIQAVGRRFMIGGEARF